MYSTLLLRVSVNHYKARFLFDLLQYSCVDIYTIYTDTQAAVAAAAAAAATLPAGYFCTGCIYLISSFISRMTSVHHTTTDQLYTKHRHVVRRVITSIASCMYRSLTCT